MTAPAPTDYPDWTTSAATRAITRQIASSPDIITAGGLFGIDCSEYQSVSILLGLGGVAVGQPVTLRITWYSSQGVLYDQYVTMWELNYAAFGVAPFRMIEVPARGTTLDIYVHGASVGLTASCNVQGSTRSIGQPHIVVPDQYAENVPFSDLGVSLAAGASISFYFGPVNANLLFTYIATGPNVSFTLSFTTYDGNTWQTKTIYTDTPAASVEKVVTVTPPQQALQLTVHNGDTGSHVIGAYASEATL